ncbi:unnamed protein product [Arctogadus glacialis]
MSIKRHPTFIIPRPRRTRSSRADLGGVTAVFCLDPRLPSAPPRPPVCFVLENVTQLCPRHTWDGLGGPLNKSSRAPPDPLTPLTSLETWSLRHYSPRVTGRSVSGTQRPLKTFSQAFKAPLG